MATTTLGVKLDDPTRERLKAAALSVDRTPHWLIKQAIFSYLEKLEGGATLTEINGQTLGLNDEAGDVQPEQGHQSFMEFAESILPQSVLRSAITAAYRRPEQEVVPMLLEQARLSAPLAEATNKLAAGIAEKLRNQKSAGGRAGIVQREPHRRPGLAGIGFPRRIGGRCDGGRRNHKKQHEGPYCMIAVQSYITGWSS